MYNKRLLEIGGLRVNKGIRAEWVQAALMAASVGMQGMSMFGSKGGGGSMQTELKLTPEEEKRHQENIGLSRDKYQAFLKGPYGLDNNLTSKYVKQLTTGVEEGTQMLEKGANAAGMDREDSGFAGRGSNLPVVGAGAIGGMYPLFSQGLWGAAGQKGDEAVVNYKNILSAERQAGAQEYGRGAQQNVLENVQGAMYGKKLGDIATAGGYTGMMMFASKANKNYAMGGY
jgi:hypothetical protein